MIQGNLLKNASCIHRCHVKDSMLPRSRHSKVFDRGLPPPLATVIYSSAPQSFEARSLPLGSPCTCSMHISNRLRIESFVARESVIVSLRDLCTEIELLDVGARIYYESIRYGGLSAVTIGHVKSGSRIRERHLVNGQSQLDSQIEEPESLRCC